MATTTETPKDPSNAPAKTMVIDCDVHEEMTSFDDDLLPYLAPQWHRMATQYAWGGKGTAIVDSMPYPFPNSGLRETWLDDAGGQAPAVDVLRRHLFDEEEVSIAILNGFYHVSSLEGAYEFGAALGAAYNDYQIEQWLEKDSRLRGSVHVVAHLPEVAAREIDRVAEHPQIVQVFLPTVTNREYGDPYYRPIFEAATRNNLAVALHHGTHTRVAMSGFPRYWAEWHALAPPLAVQIQLTSLMFNGVFDDFPELKVVALEAGVAWVPWFMWRLDEHYKCARADIPWVKRLPSDHMRDSIRVTTHPMADVTPRQFVTLAEMCEGERIFVFATDYPHFDADSVDTILPRKVIPDAFREQVLYKNALEAFPRLRSLAG